MSALRCKPRDLCVITGAQPELAINGKVVRLTDKPPELFLGSWMWTLEEPIDVHPTAAIKSVLTGCIIYPGSVGECVDMPDEMLTPIGNPSALEVDEMVRKLGPAPRTLTEVREQSREVAL